MFAIGSLVFRRQTAAHTGDLLSASEKSATSGSVAAGACAGCATQCARRWQCRASSARHEPWVRATADWRRLFARSIGGVLRLCRGDLEAAAAGWTTWPRICGTVRAANGRRGLPGHKARDVANRTTRCGERPKISDPRSSAEGASVFVGTLLSAFGALRSRAQRMLHRGRAAALAAALAAPQVPSYRCNDALLRGAR